VVVAIAILLDGFNLKQQSVIFLLGVDAIV